VLVKTTDQEDPASATEPSPSVPNARVWSKARPGKETSPTRPRSPRPHPRPAAMSGDRDRVCRTRRPCCGGPLRRCRIVVFCGVLAASLIVRSTGAGDGFTARVAAGFEVGDLRRQHTLEAQP
jgi:hypothetical protein